MSNYKVEYLSVINSEETFCKSISSFNNLLQSYDNIKIKQNSIEFEGVKFGYDVQYGEIQENIQRFFHVKLNCTEEQELLKFKLLLKSVRTILTKNSGKPPETLWNDLSSELSNKAYPLVHEIENMMRKLITKFMLTTIGLAWTNDTVPKEVSESIKNKNPSHSQNYLYEADFIQLSNFLFKEYSTANSNKLVEKLGLATEISDLDLIELKELVPKSNWERYFVPIVDCKSEYLKTRWEKLYDLRCKVAHNKFISAEDFENIQQISNEVKEKLNKALDNLDKVQVSEEQKEDVAESIASSMNALYGEFILSWNMVPELMNHLLNISSNGDISERAGRLLNPKSMIKKLVDDGILSAEFGSYVIELNDLRNAIVHHADLKVKESTLHTYLDMLESIKSDLVNTIEGYEPKN